MFFNRSRVFCNISVVNSHEDLVSTTAQRRSTILGLDGHLFLRLMVLVAEMKVTPIL